MDVNTYRLIYLLDGRRLTSDEFDSTETPLEVARRYDHVNLNAVEVWDREIEEWLTA